MGIQKLSKLPPAKAVAGVAEAQANASLRGRELVVLFSDDCDADQLRKVQAGMERVGMRGVILMVLPTYGDIAVLDEQEQDNLLEALQRMKVLRGG